MPSFPHEQLAVGRAMLRWGAIAGVVGALAGVASAVFLLALDQATGFREAHPVMVWLLPVGGLAIGLLYLWLGAPVEAGNNLVLDEIHDPQRRLPLRMAPLILVATVATHAVGGSAGREGTAVQMGASLADQLTRWLHLERHDRRILLMAGISGGFAAVFGTPLAGLVFALEVLAIGTLRWDALFPCLVAAVVGDRVCVGLGVVHTVYPVAPLGGLTWAGLGSALALGLAAGLTALAFIRATQGLTGFARGIVPWMPLRLAVGGGLLLMAVWAWGFNTRYLGLGIPLMVESFQHPVWAGDFAVKLLFTAVTLGFGFKGGEVTPLFCIGATLGSAAALVLPLPVDALAGLGFVAVFAGAANTPVACTLMACELFGSSLGVYAAIACVVSYLISGHAGIYKSQRVGAPKHAQAGVAPGTRLGDLPGH